MRVLSDESKHQTLVSAYDELTKNKNKYTMYTWAAQRGEPTSIYAASKVYFNSFLPRSVRDLKLRSTNTKVKGQLTHNNKQVYAAILTHTDIYH